MYHSIWVFHCFKKRLQLHDQLVNSVGLVLRSLGSESPGFRVLRVQGSGFIKFGFSAGVEGNSALCFAKGTSSRCGMLTGEAR